MNQLPTEALELVEDVTHAAEALDGLLFENGTGTLGVPVDTYREQTPDAHSAAKARAVDMPLPELVGRLMACADEIHARVTDAQPTEGGEGAA